MGRRFILAFILSFFVISLFGGCKKSVTEIVAPAEVVTIESADGGQIPVDVYMDATVSMKGFTTLANGNLYRTLPDLLTDIGDSMGEVAFYKFGENVTKTEGREHRQLATPTPYVELITAVHNVVETANPEHLSVIVTDLFESDSDWTNVTKKLKDKYFANHQAVAIIGVKNPFYGEIFDVGLNAAKYNYNSGSDPAKFRPFYLLVMGRESKVREFMEQFKEKVGAENETGFLLLSEHLTEGIDPFNKIQLDEGLENLYENAALGLKDPTMREFGASDKKNAATLVVPFNYKPFFGAPPIDTSRLNVKVSGFSLKEKDDSEENHWDKIDDTDKIKTELVKLDENQYKLKIQFTPFEVFEKGAINLINVRISPDTKAYTLPAWVGAWNMPSVDIDPNNFDGSKTANLNHVVESLKNSALSVSVPTLLNINLVFDER